MAETGQGCCRKPDRDTERAEGSSDLYSLLVTCDIYILYSADYQSISQSTINIKRMISLKENEGFENSKPNFRTKSG